MIDEKSIRDLARLAALRVPESDLKALQEDLCSILKVVRGMANLPLNGVPPTWWGRPEGVWRSDVPAPPLPPPVALEGAPDVENGCFRMPPLEEPG